LRTTLALLLASSAAGCTLDGGLVPPNPIPEVRPTDASTLAQNPMPVSTSDDDRSPPMLAPAPAEGPVVASQLPPPAASQSMQPAPPPLTRGSAASFPAANDRQPPPPMQAPAPGHTVIGGQPRTSSEASLTPAARKPRTRERMAIVRFTPVIGAPASAIRPLSEGLEEAAKGRGVTIRNSADDPVDNILRGYFSASTTGRETDVVYVWDILDTDGNLQHRIQGTEKVTGRGGKEWSAVSGSVMREIARKTIADYAEWHASAGG